jgi:hypothetical protein
VLPHRYGLPICCSAKAMAVAAALLGAWLTPGRQFGALTVVT